MARSMLSLGMFTARAASIAVRNRGFPPGSPSPALAATVISRMHLAHTADRLLSVAAFLCLICFHLLWPAIVAPSRHTALKHRVHNRFRQFQAPAARSEERRVGKECRSRWS